MKKHVLRISLLTLAVLIALLSTSVAVFAAGGNPGNGNANQTQVVPLTDEETGWLVFMRQEEKLARDVYLELNDLWNEPVFANIAASEQRHMDTVEKLLDKYGIEDPVTDETIRGEFTDQGLQALYDTLVAKGTLSVIDAYEVGVLIEETDIADIEEALLDTDDSHTDIERVYNHLLDGSNSHLIAFSSHLD